VTRQLNDWFVDSLFNYTSQHLDKSNFVQDNRKNLPLISYLWLHFFHREERPNEFY
jgi:hypothetical protein